MSAQPSIVLKQKLTLKENDMTAKTPISRSHSRLLTRPIANSSLSGAKCDFPVITGSAPPRDNFPDDKIFARVSDRQVRNHKAKAHAKEKDMTTTSPISRRLTG